MVEHVPFALKQLYRRWLGELAWIEAPPKTMVRPSRDRDGFVADAPSRAVRAEEIRTALPHIAYVIGIYDPVWKPEDAQPIRPKKTSDQKPPQGWTATAFEVLREAERPLTIAETVERMCERYNLDLSTVALRQRRHTAVTGMLKVYKDVIAVDGGTPRRIALRSKGYIA